MAPKLIINGLIPNQPNEPDQIGIVPKFARCLTFELVPSRSEDPMKLSLASIQYSLSLTRSIVRPLGHLWSRSSSSLIGCLRFRTGHAGCFASLYSTTQHHYYYSTTQHLRYFLSFSIRKNDICCIFYQVSSPEGRLLK